MSQKDVLERKIAFLEKYFFAVLAVIISLIGYIATNIHADPLIITVGIGFMIICIYVIIELGIKIYSYIDQLKEF